MANKFFETIKNTVGGLFGGNKNSNTGASSSGAGIATSASAASAAPAPHLEQSTNSIVSYNSGIAGTREYAERNYDSFKQQYNLARQAGVSDNQFYSDYKNGVRWLDQANNAGTGIRQYDSGIKGTRDYAASHMDEFRSQYQLARQAGVSDDDFYREYGNGQRWTTEPEDKPTNLDVANGAGSKEPGLVDKATSLVNDSKLWNDWQDRRMERWQKKYGSGVFADDFWGQTQANYGQAFLAQELNRMYNDLADNPDDEHDRQYISQLEQMLENYQIRNEKALDDENVQAAWISKHIAGYAPQLVAEVVPAAGAAAVGLLVAGPAGAWSAYRVARTITSGINGYEVARGASYSSLIKAGASPDVARAAATDEAVISSIIEMGDTAVDMFARIPGLGKILGRGGEQVAVKTIGGILKSYGFNVAQEGAEEFFQEILSAANRERVMAGEGDSGYGGLIKYWLRYQLQLAKGEHSDELAQAMEAAKGGAIIGAVMGGAHLVGGRIQQGVNDRQVSSILQRIEENPDGLAYAKDENLEYYLKRAQQDGATKNENAAKLIQQELDTRNKLRDSIVDQNGKPVYRYMNDNQKAELKAQLETMQRDDITSDKVDLLGLHILYDQCLACGADDRIKNMLRDESLSRMTEAIIRRKNEQAVQQGDINPPSSPTPGLNVPEVQQDEIAAQNEQAQQTVADAQDVEALIAEEEKKFTSENADSYGDNLFDATFNHLVEMFGEEAAKNHFEKGKTYYDNKQSGNSYELSEADYAFLEGANESLKEATPGTPEYEAREKALNEAKEQVLRKKERTLSALHTGENAVDNSYGELGSGKDVDGRTVYVSEDGIERTVLDDSDGDLPYIISTDDGGNILTDENVHPWFKKFKQIFQKWFVDDIIATNGSFSVDQYSEGSLSSLENGLFGVQLALKGGRSKIAMDVSERGGFTHEMTHQFQVLADIANSKQTRNLVDDLLLDPSVVSDDLYESAWKAISKAYKAEIEKAVSDRIEILEKNGRFANLSDAETEKAHKDVRDYETMQLVHQEMFANIAGACGVYGVKFQEATKALVNDSRFSQILTLAAQTAGATYNDIKVIASWYNNMADAVGGVTLTESINQLYDIVQKRNAGGRNNEQTDVAPGKPETVNKGGGGESGVQRIDASERTRAGESETESPVQGDSEFRPDSSGSDLRLGKSEQVTRDKEAALLKEYGKREVAFAISKAASDIAQHKFDFDAKNIDTLDPAIQDKRKAMDRLRKMAKDVAEGKVGAYEFAQFLKGAQKDRFLGQYFNAETEKHLFGAIDNLINAFEDAEKTASPVAASNYGYAAQRVMQMLSKRMERWDLSDRDKIRLGLEANRAVDSNKRLSKRRARFNQSGETFLDSATNFLTRMQINPTNVFRGLFGGWNKYGGSLGYQISEQQDNATRVNQSVIANAQMAFLDVRKMKGFQKFAQQKDSKSIDIDGVSLDLSQQQVIALYKTVRTLLADERNNVREFHIEDGNGKMQTLSFKNPIGRGKLKDMQRALWSEIGEVGKAYLEVTDNIFEDLGKQNADVEERTYGYRPKEFKKGDYIHVRYDSNAKSAASIDDSVPFGFTQERTRDANGAVLIEPITAVVDRYINQSANHIAYTELGDQLALMNRTDAAGRSLTEIMNDNYGKQMGQWMTNYVTDMNNFNPKDNTDGVSTMLRKGRQAVQTGALVGSVSVPMKQISSYWAAAGKLRMSTLRKAYRIKFVGAKSKGTQNPLLYYRKVGGIDPTMSEIMNSDGLWAKMRNKSKILQAMEKSIPTMDFRTIDNLYTACVLEVKEDNPRLDVKSEKFQQMVNDKFEDVVISTQPIFTRNARAEYARTNNEFIKMFSMFRTQQTQNLNRIMQAIGEAKASKGTLGEFAAQSELGETIKGQAASALSLSLLTVLADTVLHKLKKYKDEDDEIDPEKVMERIGLNAIEAGSGTVWFADSALKFAIDTINKARGESSSEFYGVNMGIVSTIGNAAEAIGNLAKNPTLSNLQYTAGYISQAMGIPLSNAYRMINGAIAWTRDVAGHIEGDDKPGEWDDILRYLDSEVVIHPWGDNLNHKVHVMLNAESKGNDQKADRIFSELPGGDKVDSAVRSDVKSRVLDGSMSRDESEYILDRYTGMEEEDIQKKNDFWEFMRDNPTYNSDEYNISESFVQHWNSEGKPANIPLNQFYECMMKAKNTSSIDVDGDGKANGKGDITKQQQLIEYINGLALTKEQKDALWVAFGYKTTSEAFKKRPWR